ncbi:MAG: hypothetical protein P1P88_24955 [Bacteroidales bacterium]|nr:hypothetical protein [Bacteroidales bacterium]
MVTYQTTKTYCPNCQHVLFRGPLSFGPGVVECKNCQQTITTGLTEWQDLSFFEKLGNVFKELFLPSFFMPNRDSFTRGFLHFFFFLFTTIITAPLIGFYEGYKDNFFATILMGLAFFWYPVFILLSRIFRISKQSVNYNKKGIIPIW